MCGRSYPEGRDFRTISLPGNSVAYVCRHCAPRVGDLEELMPPARKTSRREEERRRYNRRNAHLLVSFTHVRGSVVYPGVVRDISQGGMRFTTATRVNSGELLNLNVFSPLTGLRIKAVARARWVVERGKHNEIGVEFAAEGRHMQLDDRRRHHRILAEFVLHCKYGDEDIEGRVRDISQGGIRFVTGKPLPRGRRVDVSLEATGRDVVTSDGDFTLSIEKTVEIISVRRNEERYEIRARFA